MRNIFILLLICMQILCINTAFSQSEWDGSSIDTDWYYADEEASSYTISTAEELAGLSILVKDYGITFEGRTINIGDDPSNPVTIDLGGSPWTPIGYWTSKTVINPFRGSVNGNNCIIKNFRTSGAYRGLFGYVRSNRNIDNDITIQDINIESTVAGSQYIGGLCGFVCGYSDGSTYRRNVTIRNCTFNGTVSATSTDSYVGGIIGQAFYLTVDKCRTAGEISGYNHTGGIIGYAKGTSNNNYRPIITNNTNAAFVNGRGSYVGGIVGYSYYTKIEYNVNGGRISGATSKTGGIVGSCANTTNVNYCLNNGNVNQGGAISGSGGTMSYCYYDKQLSNTKGLTNTEDVPNKYVGLLTSEMTGSSPSGLSGTNWSSTYWSFSTDLYPIPIDVASSNFAKLAATPIFLDPAENWDSVETDFTLGSEASWSSSNESFISISGTTADVRSSDDRTNLTATIGGLSKVIEVRNMSIPTTLDITSPEDLMAFRDAINGVADNYKGATSYSGFSEYTFRMTANINIAAIDEWTPIGVDAQHAFSGIFDGQGHTINGLHVNSSSKYSGLFGYVLSGSIRNVVVTNGKVKGTTYVGGICGFIKSSASSLMIEISNCHFSGKVTSASTSSVYAGGICGRADTYVRINGCSNSGAGVFVNGGNFVGGIAGYVYGGSNTTPTTIGYLMNCINLADTVKGNSSVGGIAGCVYCFTDVKTNFNAGMVTGIDATKTGGIIGCTENVKQINVINNINVATVNGGSSIIGMHKDTEYDVAPENNYYDNQFSLNGGISGADVPGAAEGKSTEDLCEMVIYGFTSDGLYPVPTAISIDNIKILAAAPAFLGTGITYNNVSAMFSVSIANSVTWWSNNGSVISFPATPPATPTETASVNGEGTAIITASKGTYTKNILICVPSSEYPIPIDDYDDLKAFRDAVNGVTDQYKGHPNTNGFSGLDFVVTDNINMTDPDDEAWTPIGTSASPFRGNFDGGNFEITNINVSRTSSNSGLFGYVFPANNNSTIENINLSGNVSSTSTYTGAIVGYAKASATATFTIQNCHFKGNLTSSTYAGGICGFIGTYCNIKDCTSASKINGTSTNVGGICGKSAGAAGAENVISGCASISTLIKGTNIVGGIVGYAKNTNVEYNINAAIAKLTNSANTSIGGIAGSIEDGTTLNECLNFITINSINKMYGSSTGTTNVNSCYYDSQHCINGSDNGSTGKTTAEMKGTGLTLTSSQWSTDAGRYPIPINIASHKAAIVAAAPVTLAGSENCQTVASDFTVYTTTGLEWTTEDGTDNITIDGSSVTIDEPFSLITLTASIDGWEKKVPLENSTFVTELTIDSIQDLENLRVAVSQGDAGRYKDVANVEGFARASFRMTTDLAITGNWTGIGTSSNPFRGTFDGGGHTISGMRASSGAARGLFGYIVNATITNLNVTTGSRQIVATTPSGGIVAKATSSTISNCSFNGNIKATGNYAGGIVGQMVSSTIENCVTSGTIISSGSYVGGICGRTEITSGESHITNCVSIANIDGLSSVGGIAGYSSNSTISNCLFAGNITGSSENVGGICGYNTDNAVVEYCLNGGTVNIMGGGVIGYQHPEATTRGNFFDKQRTDLNGIAHIGEGGPSDENATGKKTTEIIGTGHGLFASGWTETAGLYPVPSAISTKDATKLASVPAVLATDEVYNNVSSDFTLGTITGLTWTVTTSDYDEDGTPYVRIDGLNARVDSDETNIAELKATYNGLTKTINVFKSSDADILTIDNPQQLKDFRDAVNNGTTGIYKGVPNINGFAGKTFILNCSPTLDAAWTPIGTADKSFSGIFDGNNNTISGLSVSGNADNKGLFGYVVNGEILNLNVTGTVAGKNNVGGICGYINGSNSSNYARIINCTFNGTASASVSYAGGIAGRNENYSSISKCMVAGSVSAVTSYAGGISGYSHSTTTSALDSISSCTNAAEVSSAKYSGGIVGRNYYSRIEYCNNGGNVSGLDYTTGGITGNNYSSSQVAYNISTAMVNNGGAVIGYNQGTSSYNYYDKQRSSVKGHSATSGISSDASAKAVGLYTINMTGETPSGLDGDNWRALYWTFTEGLYPIPAALGENDFTIATSTPIFLANNEPWDNVTHDFVLGVPSTTTWVSSDALFVNVSAAPNAVVDNYDTNGDDIIDDNDNHSTILTSTLGTVSKNYTIIDYGENTPELIIRNIDDLKDFRDAVNAGSDGSYNGIINVGGYLGYNIILDADIDLSGEENWEPIGNNLGCCFAGNFIGNSHTISNLKITATESYAGLFGYVKKGGISGITLTDVNISNSTSYTGAICGYIIGDNTAHSDISDCTVSGQLKSTTSNSYLGGIVGAAGSYSGIYNCINEANLIGRNYTGGICGSVSAGNINDDIISDCENSGTITANSASYHYIGGIVGYIQTAGLIVYCRNIGDIKGGYEIGGISGYLVGSNDYGRKGTISECWNNGKIESISTTKGYAGGLVGRMTTFVKIEKGVNSGNVIGKHSNIGGVTGTSTATRDDKENLITKCTNSAVVSSPTANFVAGICGMDSLTTISYCNNGGNVVGSDPIYVGGITGHNNNSTLTYNISTGSVEPASTTNGIYGTNTGVVTENYYDSQRSKWESSDEGKTTLELTGETPSALTDAAWAENFVLTENMYPMPTDLESEPEVQLAATPIFLNSSPIENYDSVISSFTVGAADSWDSSWEGEETDVVVILDAAVTVNNKCETIPVTLTAELSGYTKEYSITVSKKMPELPASPENPSFVWYGRETDWNTPGNWMFYDGSYETATLVPETEDDNVIITEMECMEIPQITANTTLHNLTIGENMGLNIASENLLTITGATTINSPIVGNVQFNAGSTCDGSSYIEGTITKIGHSRFKFLTGNADLQSAFEMTPVSDATVTVHYDTVRSEMPDWWSHGGNMNGGLNHVSDREYWYVQSTANLEDVTLYWVGNGNHGISSDELGNLRDYLTVAYTDGSNWMNAGASFPVDYESEISLEYGYVTASNVIPFGTRSGKYITEGSTDGEKLVLPIELVSFTASCNGNSVEVEWTTASENNNDYFILEKSYDAVNFSEIARIEGIGNSIVENRYSYTDNENYGGEMYYRLQQVDYDGIRTVSEIIVAKCTDYELEPTVAVFPNPFRSKVTLSLENFGNKPATIEVFNVMGTLVRTIDINATGNNYETVLNLEELSAATYTIRISTADFVVNKRVVKQ